MRNYSKFHYFFITSIFFFCCHPKPSYKAKLGEIPVDSSVHNRYTWLGSYNYKAAVVNRIPVPQGFERVKAEKHSFADWLRHFPLKPAGEKVYLYNKQLKGLQNVHEAVLDIDAGGKENLQQCADAVIRLRAEYLYSINDWKDIHFNFTSGDKASWDQWRMGYRPVISGNKVTWTKSKTEDNSYSNFKEYMRMVFRYAGTASLSKELKTKSIAEIYPGDVFIQGGFPGHAVIVVDVAEHKKTKQRIFLLAQSYMPAQDIHLLKNHEDEEFSPWYSVTTEEDKLVTPEWTFNRTDMKTF